MDWKRELQIGAGHCKKVKIGGAASVAIQTMWKEKLTPSDVAGEGGKETLRRIAELEALGCSILRFAVPDIESAAPLGELCKISTMPLVADIHFDYKIALKILDYPVSKIRINPGNIGSKERVLEVLRKCKDKNVPVRIGVNGGSLPRDLREKAEAGEIGEAEALVKAAERELEIFSENDFPNVAVSLKASSVYRTVAANRLFAKKYAIPLHIGVTEAGPLIAGVVRNTAALYNLLCENIGDTVRISLSDSMKNEVIAARELLGAVRDFYEESGKTPPREFAPGVKIISCPRCGRCSFDTHKFISEWQEKFYSLKANKTVAVMGCPVNGPGEARAADLGITGAGGKTIIFKNGEIIERAPPEEAARTFEREISNF